MEWAVYLNFIVRNLRMISNSLLVYILCLLLFDVCCVGENVYTNNS